MDAATRAAAAACTEPAAAREGEVLVSALVSVMAQTSTHQQGKRAGQERHAARANARQPRTAPHIPRAPALLAPKRSTHPVWAPRSLGGKASAPSAVSLSSSFPK